MINIPFSIEPASSLRRFREHAVTAWSRRPIGDAMLHNVNVNTGTQRFVEAFAAGAINYFFNEEIGGLGVFAMKECGGNPNFIGDSNFGKYLGFHKPSP